VLRRLGDDVPLAGEVALDAKRADAALRALLPRVPGVADVAALAEGIIRIAEAKMVGAIKEISIAKGHDPRDFALVAYGGAGPVPAAFIAEELEMPRVIVPPAPGNFSAFGSLISDLRRDYVRTRLTHTRRDAFDEVARLFAEMEGEARADLEAEGIAPERITLTRTVGMRYVGQSWELLVRVPDDATSMSALEAAFQRGHERRYGHARDAAAEIVNFRLAAAGAVPKPTLPRWSVTGTIASAQRAERAAYFGSETLRTPVYARDRLPGGVPVTGPAIVEEMGATTVVPPGWKATVGTWGELVLERRTV
jgi:N-methylhydantoinase A